MYCADYDTSISYQASTLSIFNLSSLLQPYANDVFLFQFHHQQLLQPQLLVPSPFSSLPLLRLTVPLDPSDGWLNTSGF